MFQLGIDMEKMKTKIICLGYILSSLFTLCYGGYCDHEAIGNCVTPVNSYLVRNNMGKSTKGLFQTSIEHYLMSLNDQHDNTIHVSSLNTVMEKIDDVFLQPKNLKESCKVFTSAEKCLKNIEVWCDQEVRDELIGLETIFNYMCQDKYKSVYLSNYKCLTKPELGEVRKTCDEKLQKTLNDIPQPSVNENNTQITGTVLQENDNSMYDLYKGGIAMNSSPDQADQKNYLRINVCRAVTRALSCYKGEVETVCNSSAAEWSYNLRHSLVQMLLMDLNCQSEDSTPFFRVPSLLNETGCFACLDGSICIDRSKRCDSNEDCPDGSDEENCGSGFQIASIFIGIVVASIVVILIIVCVVKCREEITYGFKRNSSTEMMSITQQEMSLGDSTPPVINGKQFIYQQVPGISATAKA